MHRAGLAFASMSQNNKTINDNKLSFYAGIDVAKATLQLSINATSWTLSNDPKGCIRILKLIAEAEATRPGYKIHVIVEATGGYEAALVETLHRANQRLSVIQPSRVRHFANAKNKRAKSDPIDAAILALPIHDDQVHAEFLFEEPFVLAVSEQHALARRKALSMRDLADQSLLLLEDGHCLRDQALEVCHLSGASEKSGFRATSLETLRQMVAANVGVTLLPTLSVKPPVARSENIHLLQFRGEAPSRRIAMLWRKSSALAPFLKKLAGVFRDLPRSLLDPHALTASAAPKARSVRT